MVIITVLVLGRITANQRVRMPHPFRYVEPLAVVGNDMYVSLPTWRIAVRAMQLKGNFGLLSNR